MSATRAGRKDALPLTKAACFTPSVDPVSIEATSPVDAGSDGVQLKREPCVGANGVPDHGVLPIVILARDGRRVLRSFRSRWSRSEQGRVDLVQMLCPDCSGPLIVRDLHLRVARTFACHLTCPGCSQGVVAWGSKRTLLMRLRLLIDEKRFDSRRRTIIDRSGPGATELGTTA